MFKENDIVVYLEDDLSKNPRLFKVKNVNVDEDMLLLIEIKNEQEIGEPFNEYRDDYLLWNDELKQKIEKAKNSINEFEKVFNEFASNFRNFRELSYELGYTTAHSLCTKLIVPMENLGRSSSSLFC